MQEHPQYNQNFLYEAFLCLKAEEEVKRFLADLCTPKEINDFVERLSIADLLKNTDKSYRDIAQEIGASTTTVSRVARFLNQEPHQGYRIVLERMEKMK